MGLRFAFPYAIAAKPNGRIALLEKPGGGSRFRVTLPACQPDPCDRG